jgi:O-antigen/teichoic acid export membrane protein
MRQDDGPGLATRVFLARLNWLRTRGDRGLGGRGRKVLSTGGALIAAQILMALAGVISSRVLGPSGRGAVTGILVWTQMLPFIALLGVNSALSVRVSSSGPRGLAVALGNTLAYSAAVGGVVTIAAVAVLPSVLSRLGPHAELISAIALCTIPIAMLAELLFSVNVALDRIRHFIVCRLIGPMLLLVTTILLWALHALTPTSVVIATVSAGSIVALLAGLGLPWRKSALVLSELRSDVVFGAKLAVAGLFELANVRLDLLVMSTFVSSAQIGFYGVANNAMIPVTTVASAAAGLLIPAVARKLADSASVEDRRSQVHMIRQEAARYGLLAGAGGCALAIVAPFGIPLVFGHAFKPAVVLIWILIPGFVIRTYASILVAGAVGMRRASVGNIVEGASLAVTAVMLPVLLPLYKAVGAAVTSTVAYSVAGLTAVVLIRRLAVKHGAPVQGSELAAEVVAAEMSAPSVSP